MLRKLADSEDASKIISRIKRKRHLYVFFMRIMMENFCRIYAYFEKHCKLLNMGYNNNEGQRKSKQSKEVMNWHDLVMSLRIHKIAS